MSYQTKRVRVKAFQVTEECIYKPDLWPLWLLACLVSPPKPYPDALLTWIYFDGGETDVFVGEWFYFDPRLNSLKLVSETVFNQKFEWVPEKGEL